MFKGWIFFLFYVTQIVSYSSSTENRFRRLIFNTDITIQQSMTPSTQASTIWASKQPLTTQALTSTTRRQPFTIPPVTTTCAVCTGPKVICEKLFAPTPCTPPNNYCINKLTNNIDGTRTVEKSCGSLDTCYNDWWVESSDKDTCRNFDGNYIFTLNFHCTYCCVTDNCNIPIRPSQDTLYKDL